MAFSIELEDSTVLHPYEDVSVPAARGLLVLGSDVESFVANLGEWDRAGYLAQWKEALRSLLKGEKKVALITTYSRPSIASHLECWALYRDGDLVHAQNQLLLYDNLEKPFSVESVNLLVRDREIVDEDGALISEWTFDLQDVRSFAEHFSGIPKKPA